MNSTRYYVADTHSIVWYLLEDPRLGNKALEIFEEPASKSIILIPTIVLAEMMFISEKGKVKISFKETLEEIEDCEKFEIIPLDLYIIRIASNFEYDLEMHDRLIVATALCFNSGLLTSDEKIREARLSNLPSVLFLRFYSYS
jgi:PIN domain nuclease of toxin-antitoxin system